VPVGNWRSVGNSHTAFYMESFVDELAHENGQDGYAYRRKLLAHRPRHLAVLDAAARKAGWGAPLEVGRGRGIAIHESFGSIVAEVADISISTGGNLRVDRVVCVVDCGVVVNPDTVEAQMQSAIVYGLTAALYGEITIKEGRVQQDNFPDYEALRMAEMPVIDVEIIESGEKIGGVGEPGLPPIAPAITNAIFNATGKRLRTLPVSKAVLS
jgi:isoquinoline 1-oxidoreductase beta subunit